MCGFFCSCLNRMGAGPFNSSTGHRNAERGNAAIEILGTALHSFSPALVIPKTFAQTLLSGYSLFRQDTSPSEKIIHFVQGGLAASQLGLAIKLLFNTAQCTDTSTTICQAVFLTQLLYQGTLLVGWIPSEFSKKPYIDPNAAAPLNAAPVAPNAPDGNHAAVVAHAPLAANHHIADDAPRRRPVAKRKRARTGTAPPKPSLVRDHDVEMASVANQHASNDDVVINMAASPTPIVHQNNI